MGTAQHHLSRSEDFLRRARDATAPIALGADPKSPDDDIRDKAAAAAAIRRAASHAATALAVHIGFPHNTTPHLYIALNEAVCTDRLRRGHLRTFRYAWNLPVVLDLPATGRPRPDGTRRPPWTPFDLGHRPKTTDTQTIRRVRRRVNVLKKDVAALIAGRPKPVHRAQWRHRFAPDEMPRVTST